MMLEIILKKNNSSKAEFISEEFTIQYPSDNLLKAFSDEYYVSRSKEVMDNYKRLKELIKRDKW